MSPLAGEARAQASACAPQHGYLETLGVALGHRKTLGVALPVAIVYLGLFVYLGGMLSHVGTSQFPGVTKFPHIAWNPDPALFMPHLGFQPVESWYLEITLVQAVELTLIAGLVVVNVALTGMHLRARGAARQASSWIGGIVPFAASNGACVACAGIPAGLASLPASLAGGVMALAQFYGIPAILTMLILGVIAAYHLDRAASLRWTRMPTTSAPSDEP